MGRRVVAVVGLCAGLALACGSRRSDANAAPLISAVTVSPDAVAPGGIVTVGASAADPDGDELRYVWTVPNGWAVQGRSDGPVLLVQAPAVASATAAVILNVVDSAGKGATQVTLLHTTPAAASTAITVAAVTAQPNPVAPGGTIDVAALAASADGAALTWRAEVSDPAWTVRPDAAGARVTAPLAYGRAATVTLYADGATGGHAVALVPVATKPWTAPVVDALVASPAVTAPGGRVQLSAAARGADGLPVSYAWSIAGDGWSLAPAGASAVATAPARTAAPATVTVTVTDAAGATAAAVVAIATSDAVPVLDAFAAQPVPVTPGGTVTATAVAHDPSGAAITYAWAVQPAEWSVTASGGAATIHAPLRYDAVGILTVTASSPWSATTARLLVSTRPWTAPTIDAVVASPAVVAPGGRAQLSAAGHGADGLAVTYAWTVAGDGWSLAPAGASAVAVAPPRAGAAATATVTVTDAAGAAASSVVALSTSDAVPVVDALTVQPLPAAPGGTVAATASAHDPAGGAVTYAWSVAPADWSVTASGGAATVRAPSRYGAVGVLTLTVAGPWSTTAASVVVSTLPYAAPQIASVLAAPAAVAPGGTAQLAVTATSPSGLPLSYAWSVAGTTGWTVTGSGAAAALAAPALPGQAAIVAVDVTDAAGATARGTVAVSTTP